MYFFRKNCWKVFFWLCFWGFLITKILVNFNVLKIIKFHIKFQYLAKITKRMLNFSHFHIFYTQIWLNCLMDDWPVRSIKKFKKRKKERKRGHYSCKTHLEEDTFASKPSIEGPMCHCPSCVEIECSTN